jgi:hypothetical protein
MFKTAARKAQRRLDTQTAMQQSWPTVPLDPMALPCPSRDVLTITIEEILDDWESGSEEPTDLSIAFVEAVSKLDEPNS